MDRQDEHAEHPVGAVNQRQAFLRGQLDRGQAGGGESVGLFLDERTGRVEQVLFTMPAPATKRQQGDDGLPELSAKPRAAVTQKGEALIGDMRTDALHAALREEPIDDGRLIALLVLAFAGNNVFTPALAKAVAQTGMTGKICAYGFDLGPAQQEALASGDLTGALGQQPFLQGFWPVMQLYLQIDRGIAAANLDTRAQLVTKDSVGAVGKRFEN